MLSRALVAGLSVNEFWDLTPYELGLVLQSDVDRSRRLQEMSAVHACWIMNVWMKRGKSVRPHQLLPSRPGTVTVDFSDFPDTESAMAWIREREEQEDA